jgi:hypothetical protein
LVAAGAVGVAAVVVLVELSGELTHSQPIVASGKKERKRWE